MTRDGKLVLINEIACEINNFVLPNTSMASMALLEINAWRDDILNKISALHTLGVSENEMVCLHYQ